MIMSSMISEDDLKEFRQEGAELLEAAEKALLSLEDEGHYKTQYNAIFRAFHNLKGAAGMMEMLQLQGHTHILETELVSLKDAENLSAEQVDYFLKGVDVAKKMLWGEALDASAEHTTATPATIDVVSTPPISSEPTPEPVSQASVDIKVAIEKQKLNLIEPTRYLLFSDKNELVDLENKLKELGYEVHNHSDYIDGITKYDQLKPHVIFISPAFCQTTPEELKSILNKDGHTQLFIDFDFSTTPFDFLMKSIKMHFENINLKNLTAEASHLLKFQYADLCQYLKSSGQEHVEKMLSEEMRDFLSYKSLINQKFRT